MNVDSSRDENLTVSEFTSKLAPAADICVGLFILTVVVLSVLGNGLVLVICYRRRKKMAGSELLCVNLALVDFLCCVCFYPLSIVSSFNHAWLGRRATCVYYGLGCYVFGLCGMFTITAISVTRYLKTCYSLAYGVWLEGANIGIACCVIWSVATVWSSFPLMGWGEYVPEPYGLSCTVAWRGYHTSAKDAFYVICSFACFTLIPVLLIVVSQCQILYKVSRFHYSLSARGIRNNLRHAEKRLSIMFFCISLGFVLAWAPYTVVSFLYIFHTEKRYMAPEGFVFPALFAKSSHVYNPFIYFYFNKTFKQELHCMLLSLWPHLGGNRVGVHHHHHHHHHHTGGHHPIHIQLQERHRGQKKRGSSALSQDRTRNKSAGRATLSGGGNRVRDKPVFVAWASASRNGSAFLDGKPARLQPDTI